MRNVVIVGGGFAGTEALKTLKTGRLRNEFDVTLVDPKEGFDFLPALPDVLSRTFAAEHLRVAYRDLAERFGANLARDRITAVDLEERIARGEAGAYPFDDVIVAVGAITNFYGNADAEEQAFRLRSLDQAREILAALDSNGFERVLVVGGGYTGVETATHLKVASQRRGRDLAVEILELTDSILPGQEPRVQSYARKQLDRIGVTIRLETTVDSMKKDQVVLTDGTRLSGCAVVWNAGVTVDVPLDPTVVEVKKGGRVKVDAFLRAADRCYVVGDAAFVEVDGAPLPMASYFSDQEGRSAARNIIRTEKKKALREYRPLNFGLVIPLATGRGCGRLLGIPVKGRKALLVHHAAAWLRARSRRNRWGRVFDLIRPLRS